MSEETVLYIFLGMWALFTVIGFSKKFSAIISIGGGFIVSMLLYATK
ncbi:hypothetical protein Q9L42_011775 [Methylomarinum sp. Ch1-1]|uniref:Uncharacterized protein n=1 Tax=Methylomarinum roseum TaxID=3067653 RepID=A0AAU7NQ09_9GAMM|nr:hypothetical protein [Methylomarinum sp. Ch1-1]MDP4521024.1 hypothetical protein [Methylomarinum sp. Ch1-1]